MPRPTMWYPRRAACRARTAVFALCGLLFVPAAAAAGSITVAWDPSPDPVAGYTIYYGTSSGTYTQSVNTTQTSHTVQGLTSGVRYFFVVKAYSSSGLYSAATNEVDGLPSNHAPVITSPGNRTAAAGAYTLSIVASDPDGDALTFSATGLPSGLLIDASTGVISGTLAGGTHNLTVTVSDGETEASATFSVTAAVNNSPTLQSLPDQSHDTSDAVSLQLVASDPDGDTLGFSASGLPAGLVLDAATGLISGTPVAGSGGVHSITVSVSDGSLSASRSFTWTVVDLNPSALVAHWKLDEGSGISVNDSAGGRVGTLTNGAAWTSGRSGMAARFDGMNDYINLPTFDLSTPAITIAAWIRSDSFSSTIDQRFLSKAAGTAEQDHYWMLGQTSVSGAARLRFRLKTGSTTTTLVASSGTLPLNTWYHAVATYDGATMRLYLDGTLVGTSTKAGAIAANASVPVSAGRSPDGSNYMHGAIDDVRVYSRALSAAEIAAIMNPAAEPTSFTDDPLVPGVHTMKAVHMTELRSRIDALRKTRGLEGMSWTPLVTGALVSAMHVTQLRAALAAVYDAAGLAAPAYDDNPLTAGTSIKAAHITQLRTLVKALE